MRSLSRKNETELERKGRRRRYRKIVTCLAAVVVFATTYALVLPAMTLDEQKAEETPGIETQTQVEQQAAPEKPDAVSEQKTEVKKEANEDASSKSEAAKSQSEQKSEKASSANNDQKSEKADASKAKNDSKDADSSKDEKKVGDSKKDKNIKLIEEKTEIKYDGNGYKIIAEVGADAKLPADTKLKVREIKKGDKDKNDNEIVYDAYCDEALTAVRNQDGEDGENLERQVKLYDLKFVSESSDKEKVEPATPVKVTIEYDEAIDRSDKNAIRMVHFDDTDMDKDKAAEAMIDKDKLHDVKKVVLETKSEKNDADSMKDVQFKSDRFSVYGLVYTVTKEPSEQAKAEEENKNTLTASDDNYEITVTYGDDAQIPEGAELRVEKIAEDDEAYAALQEDVANNLDKEEMAIPKKPALFDISILVDGEEIEPAEGSEVNVEVKIASDTMDGMFTGEDAPLLVNDDPIDEEMSNLDNSIQVIHQVEEGKLEVMETEDEITEDEATSSFTTDSFSNWLLYLDEDVSDIYVTTHDSITLRPYTQWVWKDEDEPAEYQGAQWSFPSSEWDSYDQGGYTFYRHRENGSLFRSFSKTDEQLNETYTVVTSEDNDPSNYLKPGDFYIRTNKGKAIHVHVSDDTTPSPKPSTVSGLPGLKVNLFDYDVPTNNGQLDFTKSGRLDEEGNKATTVNNPPYNGSVNAGHNLKFLGWGYDGDGHGVNSYTKDNAKQGIVQNHLDDNHFPVLADGSNQSLGYLFDTGSHNSNVYAFANAGGLFQQDSKGFYYYNSNSNYAEYDQSTNQFKLYEHTYSQHTAGSSGVNAKPIGFFPFHEYDTGNPSQMQTGMNHNKDLNHHFGMSMNVEFTIPSDKKAEGPDGQKHDIIYEFSGDDDLWVFIDDELVLDIGGIHQPVTGSINFTTGVIKVHGKNDITKTFAVGEHTLRMFYIERGGCDSNLSVKFNLPLIPTGSVTVAKYDKSANPVAPLQGVKFAVYSDQQCTNKIGDYTSDSNGLIKIEDLQIRDDNTRYYLKETKPLSGYKQDETIYTLVPVLAQQSPKKYEFKIFDGEEEITTIGQNPAYPVLYNEEMKPINLTVEKQWKDKNGEDVTIPSNASATFKVQRLFKYEGDEETTETVEGETEYTLNVYRHNPYNNQDTLVFKKDYKRGTSATITWKYNSTYANSGKNQYYNYKINNGSWQSCSNTGGSVTQTIPNEGELNVYVTDEWINYNGGATLEKNGGSITSTGTEGAKKTETQTVTHHVSTDWAPDDSYNRAANVPTITLPEKNTDPDSWKGKFRDLTVLEDKDGKTYQYKYYIVETNKMPSDSEVVYVDGSGQTVSNPSTLATDSNGTQTIINKVPTGYLQIEKKVTFNNSDQNLTADQKSKLAGEYKFKIYTTAQCGDGDAVQDPNAAADVADKDLTITLIIGEDGQADSSTPIKLVAGNYWIKEVETSNPGMFPVDNPIEVTVTKDNTTNSPVIKSLTNNYDENNGPDKIAIDIEKKFQGLESNTQVPSSFKVMLQYTVGGELKTVTLENKIATGENGEKIAWSEKDAGFTWHWKVTNIPSSAKDFKIKEDYYNRAIAHDWKSASLNGTDITSTVTSYHDLVVTAPTATLSDVTNDRRTSDSGNNTEFYLDDDDILLSKLTANQGTLVISKKPLNLAERDAVQKGWPQQGGFKTPPHYFSIEEHPNGFTYGNKTVTFGEKDGRTTVKFTQNASAQEAVFAVSYSSQDARNNANLVNVYEEVPITVDIVKVDKKNAKKLAGAVFTIRPIKDEVLDDGTLPTVDGKTASDTAATDADGKTSITGLTHGYYEVKEKSAPAGYVMTDDTTFYFKVENGSVTWLEKGTGAPSTWNTKTAGANDMVTFTAGSPAAGGQAATNATFTVKNEPGAALPSAGGPGTTWMYILGSLLTLMAGVTLVARRRMRA